MEQINLVESFSEFKEFKNIDRATMMRILEDVFRSLLAKKFGSSDNFDIVVNVDKGDLEIWRNRTIVEDNAVEDENQQIAYSDAIKIEPSLENNPMMGDILRQFQMEALMDYFCWSDRNKCLKKLEKIIKEIKR